MLSCEVRFWMKQFYKFHPSVLGSYFVCVWVSVYGSVGWAWACVCVWVWVWVQWVLSLVCVSVWVCVCERVNAVSRYKGKAQWQIIIDTRSCFTTGTSADSQPRELTETTPTETSQLLVKGIENALVSLNIGIRQPVMRDRRHCRRIS